MLELRELVKHYRVGEGEPVRAVDGADLDGSPRRHQGLGRHLSAKGPLALFYGVSPAKSIDLDPFEVEQIDK